MSRRLSRRLAGLLLGTLLAVSGCGGGKEVDCGKLADHLAELNARTFPPDQQEQMRKRTRTLQEEVCRGGSYTASQKECLMKAQSENDTWPCIGLPSPTATPPAPPPPPAIDAAAEPSLAELTARLAAILTRIAADIDVATMHGCAESPDRIDQLFEDARAPIDELRAALTPARSADLQAIIKDRTDAAVTAQLVRLDAAVAGCEEATKELQDELANTIRARAR